MLKPIVIDGSNVALSHGNNLIFSCKGIRICVDWFRNRGHKDIKAFVPSWRKESTRSKSPIKDQDILFELEREDFLVFTPSRWICGKRIICYDDRYILKFAADIDGIVVSNDNYRDLIAECHEFKKVVVERVLMYSFINDRFMPPDDPLGRNGPSLDDFLRKRDRCEDNAPLCPYGKKCTYGHKCKYRHTCNDSNSTITNHNALRKTVSAPPYLDNQQVSKGKAKNNIFEAQNSTYSVNSTPINGYQINIRDHTENINETFNFHKPLSSKQNSCPSDGNSLSDWSLTESTLVDKTTENYGFVNSHKKLTIAASAPVVLNKHKKLTRLSSTPCKPNTVIETSDVTDISVREKRQQLHFHLSNVFPSEHVDSVFRLLPDETNPNVICDALVKLNVSNS